MDPIAPGRENRKKGGGEGGGGKKMKKGSIVWGGKREKREVSGIQLGRGKTKRGRL